MVASPKKWHESGVKTEDFNLWVKGIIYWPSILSLHKIMVPVEDSAHVTLIVLDLDIIDAVLHETVVYEDALNGTVAVGVSPPLMVLKYQRCFLFLYIFTFSINDDFLILIKAK